MRLATTSAEPRDLPRGGVLVNYPVEPGSDGTFRENIAAHSLLTRRKPDLAGPPQGYSQQTSGFRRQTVRWPEIVPGLEVSGDVRRAHKPHCREQFPVSDVKGLVCL